MFFLNYVKMPKKEISHICLFFHTCISVNVINGDTQITSSFEGLTQTMHSWIRKYCWHNSINQGIWISHQNCFCKLIFSGALCVESSYTWNINVHCAWSWAKNILSSYIYDFLLNYMPNISLHRIHTIWNCFFLCDVSSYFGVNWKSFSVWNCFASLFWN